MRDGSGAENRSGRLGDGLWPTGPGTGHCPAADRSPIATAATNAGGRLVKRAGVIGELNQDDREPLNEQVHL